MKPRHGLRKGHVWRRAGRAVRLGVMKPSPVVRSTLSRDDPPAFYGTVLRMQLDSHE
jgi:hypothetical protein